MEVLRLTHNPHFCSLRMYTLIVYFQSGNLVQKTERWIACCSREMAERSVNSVPWAISYNNKSRCDKSLHTDFKEQQEGWDGFHSVGVRPGVAFDPFIKQGPLKATSAVYLLHSPCVVHCLSCAYIKSSVLCQHQTGPRVGEGNSQSQVEETHNLLHSMLTCGFLFLLLDLVGI